MNMDPENDNVQDEGPLITFVILAYKQEEFIEEALAAAFSQTYSPLEILVSDDCSPDRTFEIIEEFSAKYQGPHRIVLNRNKVNAGLGQHVNEVMSRASGELVVMAAGDDVSEPFRVEELVSAWLAAGRPPVVGSNYIEIDEAGREIGQAPQWVSDNARRLETIRLPDIANTFRSERPMTIPGCVAAWSSRIWECFGDLGKDLVCEDEVLSFRSALLGGAAFVPRPLVRYRRHSSNIWSSQREAFKRTGEHYVNHEKTIAYQERLRIASYANILSDTEIAMESGIADRDVLLQIQTEVQRLLEKAGIAARWWEYSLLEKLRNFWAVKEAGFFQSLLKFLPLEAYAAVRAKCALIMHGEKA